MTGNDITTRIAEGSVELEIAGHTAAAATIRQAAQAVDVEFSVAAGHWPSSVRAELVNAVFDSGQVIDNSHLHAAFPMGDCELLRDIASHCSEVHTHGAGATCLLDGTVIASTGK